LFVIFDDGFSIYNCSDFSFENAQMKIRFMFYFICAFCFKKNFISADSSIYRAFV